MRIGLGTGKLRLLVTSGKEDGNHLRQEKNHERERKAYSFHEAPQNEVIRRIIVCPGRNESVDALRAFPVDDVDKIPGILSQLELQLAVRIDGQLRGRIKNTSALVLFLVVEVEFAGGQIEGG